MHIHTYIYIYYRLVPFLNVEQLVSTIMVIRGSTLFTSTFILDVFEFVYVKDLEREGKE